MLKTVVAGLVICACLRAQEPMKPRYEDGANFRWLNKTVWQNRVLDGMESTAEWKFTGSGEMTLSDAEVHAGKHSLRLHSTTGEATTGGEGEWIDLMATRRFAAEDWSAYNRLSLWVYPDVKGAPAISCTLILHNDGAHKLPDRYNEGRDESIALRNRQWNHVVWEIAPLDRDRVTAVDFAYSLPKKYPDPGDQTTLYIDQLELQKVDADHVEGWDVAAGKIAFSGGGYPLGGTNTALASDLKAETFSVERVDSGEVVLSHAVETKETPLGKYQVLDFSALHTPGKYVIHAGDVVTRPFEIGADPWRSSILKAINFLYSERCGTVIPGLHGICHQDCYTEHNGRRIIVNGGYHDAGDLSATGHTPGISYALFEMAQRLHRQGNDPALEARVLEEAEWGLKWVLKTSFGDGYRTTGQLISYWTNGIMGDGDDRHGVAVNDPEWNFRVSSTEAIAYRVLKESDPELANRSLATAKQDWEFAVKGLAVAAPIEPVYGQKDELERISIGALASADLFEATGEQKYADEAFALADQILASQERKLQAWTIPLTGYFYSSPKREALFQRFHIGEEQAPVEALAKLCDLFPTDARWIHWYSALVLHSKFYLERAAQVNEPYAVLPAAIYRESDAKFIGGKKNWTPLRAADADAYRAEVRAGVPLGGEYYLRRFPVWFDFRGNFSVLLSQAKALATEAQLRGDVDGIRLAERQAEWVLGRNPFAASVMYGEGYDWTPLYSVRSGQMVGALPVGIETKGFSDAPYWPTQIDWTYKEVWTHSVGRWLWLMEDLNGPARVSGEALGGVVEVHNLQAGEVEPVQTGSGGYFQADLPEGEYEVRQGHEIANLAVVPGRDYRVDLRPGRALGLTGTVQHEAGSRHVSLVLRASGSGAHEFALRAENLRLDQRTRSLELKGEATVEWQGEIEDPEKPWVAVVIPDGAMEQKQEFSGSAR